MRYIRRYFFFIFIDLLVFSKSAIQSAPNIIVILTDDLGFGDVEYNCNNANLCPKTPNLGSLAMSKNSAVFHRFYATAGICSPTRASIMTGRNNQRDCIEKGLGCDAMNPAQTCTMAKEGGFPLNEFTFAKAAKKSTIGNYSTLHVGKWHLGDLWDKNLPDEWGVSAPWHAGFDEWLSTQAESSSSTPNCGCFPISHHGEEGDKPPYSDISEIYPYGDECYVGGGYASNWTYPCINYYHANVSDPRNVSDLQHRIPEDDSMFIIKTFEEFLNNLISSNDSDHDVNKSPNFLAHLCMHAIHEPHPSLSQYFNQYEQDADYLGAITQMDHAIGVLIDILKKYHVYDNTFLIFTSDNGPHQGLDRSNILYSTNFLRQCKKSSFEGGLRVPALIHAPFLIKSNRNITAPVGSVDIMPTIMELLNVTSDNPTWIMDGISLVPYLTAPTPIPPTPSSVKSSTSSTLALAAHTPQNVDITRRSPEHPLNFWYVNTSVIIDNEWKLIYQPELGSVNCEVQPPYNTINLVDQYFLFDLSSDIHELDNLIDVHTVKFKELKAKLDAFKISANYSQHYETGCSAWHSG